MYPADFATATPDRPAVIMTGTGQRQTYRELVAGANRLARLLREAGLRPGDHYAILAENHLRYFELAWAGLNIGLYVTPINSHLTAPEVADVAVFGIPHPDLGEQVKAVVQPERWEDAGEDLAERLLEHCRTRLTPFKWPRSIDFMRELPRQDNGKLYKKVLRDPYWSPAAPAESAS